jgi:CHAD domain-containing protein
MRATLDGLLDHFKGKLSRDALSTVRKRISHLSAQTVARAMERKSAFKDARKTLKKCRDRIRELTLEPGGWRAVAAGMAETYRRGYDGYHLAMRDPTGPAFHEWRKSTKYLRHQLELVEDSWPPVLHEMVQELHDLSDYLGEDHDLLVLRDKIATAPSDFGDAGTVETAFALIERWQEELREKADLLGERIYAEKPKALVHRIHQYWRAARRPPPTPEPLPRLLIAG